MLNFINMLNNMPISMLWLLQILVSYGVLLIMLRMFGVMGVIVTMVVVIIAANIQVLKPVILPFYANPVPLGTVLFATNYLASDILTEYYGAAVARRAVMLTILGFIVMTLFMVITMGFQPLSSQAIYEFKISNASSIQHALITLFSPAPILLVCSLFSFWVSQFTEISLFSFIKRLTGRRWLWLRNNASTWLAALLDNIVFSLLVWRVFAIAPVSWHSLIVGYIFGTYILRIALALLDTPFIYLAGKAVKHSKNVETAVLISHIYE